MKYIFGPVNSRRLGLSLGIDLLPPKVCNFNCIYCEVGPTTLLTCERREYIPTEDILAELADFFKDTARAASLDAVTITASGEPTLHSGIGRVIRYLKEHTGKTVAVITNGALLHDRHVREELLPTDIVMPSLDAARLESLHRVNRPARGVSLHDIKAGLRAFGREFSGRLWLEILLVRGGNDSPEDIRALQKILATLRTDRVQLNTVARPSAAALAAPVSRERLEEIAAQLGEGVEIIADFTGRAQRTRHQVTDAEIERVLERRPSTAADICQALNADPNKIALALARLERVGVVQEIVHNGLLYFATSAHGQGQHSFQGALTQTN